MNGRMEGFQTSNSESEQLVFDFFHNRGSDKTKPDLVDLDPLASALTTLVVPPVGCAKGDIYMVSSDTEEEEEPFVPLALRLKQKPNNLHSQLGTHELWVSGNSNKNLKIHPEPVMADDLMNIHDDLDTRNHHSASSAKELVAVTEKRRLPSAEIGNRREVGLRRKVQREKQQVEKGQRKMEKRALVDTVKALRPEECLKHIIIVVDPGRWDCFSSFFFYFLAIFIQSTHCQL